MIGQEKRIEKRSINVKGLEDLQSVTVCCDKDLIHQVVYNLVDNAIKFTNQGGEIVFSGTVDEILRCEKSITGQYLSGSKQIELPEKRREGNGKFLSVKGASQNNLKNAKGSKKHGY